MKRSVKKTINIIAIGVFMIMAIPVSAKTAVVCDTVGEKNVTVLAGNDVAFTRVGLSEIPQAVKSEVAIKYAAYRIGVSYRGSDDTFKLVIKSGDSKLTLIYHRSGQCIKSDSHSAWKRVIFG